MGFTKLFTEILQSSVWNEEDATRIAWITLLAMRGSDHVARCSVSGLAHSARISLAAAKKAVEVLSAPDEDSRSSDWEGRRIERVEEGFLVLNGQRYLEKRDPEHRRQYMREYMAERRKQSLTPVNSGKPPLAQSESESESESEKKKSSSIVEADESEPRIKNGVAAKKPRQRGPLMDAAAMEEFRNNPAYESIDLTKEAWKFKAWCEKNKKPQSQKRFVNWLNRI